LFNKLKRCNFDPELYQALKDSSRPQIACGETKDEDRFVRTSNGEIKIGKNGKAIRKQKRKPKPVGSTDEIKDENPTDKDKVSTETKKTVRKTNRNAQA
jgi:hypothetical protein